MSIDTKLAILRARAITTRTRQNARRAKSEAVLADVLPAEPANGHSYHVISHGDVDALSYLAHCVKAWPLDYVLISTWCMAMTDVDQLLCWLDTGRVGFLEFCCGEIFPTQYPDEADRLFRLEANGGDVKIAIARNHAKVLLGKNDDLGVYLTIESSANVNTNPRIEQACLTLDQELFEFYQGFFAGLKTVYQNPYAPRHPS